METHNTREGIEELDNLANIYGWHHEKCAGHAHFPSCPVVKLRRILVSEQETHHQELQKAREEERKKVLWNIGAMIEEADFARKVTERTGEALPTLEVQAVIRQVQFMLDRYQSELDQPTV